eukprot:6473077-Amphidinium_carterae.1
MGEEDILAGLVSQHGHETEGASEDSGRPLQDHCKTPRASLGDLLKLMLGSSAGMPEWATKSALTLVDETASTLMDVLRPHAAGRGMQSVAPWSAGLRPLQPHAAVAADAIGSRSARVAKVYAHAKSRHRRNFYGSCADVCIAGDEEKYSPADFDDAEAEQYMHLVNRRFRRPSANANLSPNEG